MQNETIAAILASQTPIGTRYAAPGTELTDGCKNCGGAHATQDCPEIAAQLHQDDGSDIKATLDYLEELVEKHGALDRVMADNTRMMGELASAHEIVGQCISAMQAALTLVNGDIELPDALSAARAWLRRRGD